MLTVFAGGGDAVRRSIGGRQGLTIIASLDDLENAARRKLPPILFQYIKGGSYGEETLAANRTDFSALRLRQRVLRDVSTIDTSVDLLGQRFALPVGLSPVGMAGLYGRRGEAQAVRAAAAANIPFCLSTVSVCSLEEVAATGRPFWFQLYMIKDRAYLESLLHRAAALGVTTLVLTVDLAVTGARYRDVHTGLTGRRTLGQQARIAWGGVTHPTWLWDVWMRGRPHGFGNLVEAIPHARAGSDFYAWIGRNFDASVTWSDLDWVRQRWSGKIVLKGILDAEDAREAVAAGVDAILVSNHGGRQLDGVRSSISALRQISDVIGSDVPLLMDGGVRSGLDVVRGLASGARASFLGRPWAYALAVGGAQGVTRMLDILAAEVRTALALTGCCSAAHVNSALLDVADD